MCVCPAVLCGTLIRWLGAEVGYQCAAAAPNRAPLVLMRHCSACAVLCPHARPQSHPHPSQHPCPILQPESDEDDEGFSKVDPSACDSSDGVDSEEPDEVELVQQLLSTEQVLIDWQQQQHAQEKQQAQEQQQAQGSNTATQGRQQVALQFQLVKLFLHLPIDLQTALLSSPARQVLLQEAASALAAGSCSEQEAAAGVLQKMQELLIASGPVSSG